MTEGESTRCQGALPVSDLYVEHVRHRSRAVKLRHATSVLARQGGCFVREVPVPRTAPSYSPVRT